MIYLSGRLEQSNLQAHNHTPGVDADEADSFRWELRVVSNTSCRSGRG